MAKFIKCKFNSTRINVDIVSSYYFDAYKMRDEEPIYTIVFEFYKIETWSYRSIEDRDRMLATIDSMLDCSSNAID